MTSTIESLGLDRLPREDRISLAQALWDSVTREAPPGLLSAGQLLELERRADEDDAFPDDVIPWDVVKAKTRTRFES